MATGQGPTWVLVADAQHGRILEVDDAGLPARLRATLHPRTERSAGGPGGVPNEVAGHGTRRHSPEHGWTHGDDNRAEVLERRFAHELVAVLERGLADTHFRHLVLVAPPRMLGILRETLTRGLADRLRASTPKDWSHLNDRELAEQVRPLVEIWPRA
jgi:protein required for attachment to host cells